MADLFGAVFGRITSDISIDLGTANTLVYVRGKGIVVSEPSVVAVNIHTQEVVAIGEDARRMVGRTPASIVAKRPLVDGVISDFEVTEAMLRHFIERVQKEQFTLLARPRVIIGIPYGVTEVERRAVEEGALSAGARQVFLIEEPLAAAIGARLPVEEPTGSLIVDIGGGTTEVAVISLGGIVTSRSLRLAGDELTEAIVTYIREAHNLLIGLRTAEEMKVALGSVLPQKELLRSTVRGRDMLTGMPKAITISDEDIRAAILPTVKLLSDNIRATIEETPPELLSDIMERGICLAGGGAQLRSLALYLEQQVGTKCYVADDPMTCVVRGAGVVLEDLDRLQQVLLSFEANYCQWWRRRWGK
ncbi:rod shape-determining protein [Candidatus Berkelbacteria bacterium]|nr:rod shape-determining protein [Candidatus Berkelbacteria bacterium]